MRSMKACRVDAMLTVRRLAAAAGVSQTTVVLVENGRSVPRFDTMLRIAGALGIEPSEIEEFAAALSKAKAA